MRRLLGAGLLASLLFALGHRRSDIPLPEDVDRAIHVGCSLHAEGGEWENVAWIDFPDHKWTFLLSKRPQEDDEQSLRDCADFLHAWKERVKQLRKAKK